MTLTDHITNTAGLTLDLLRVGNGTHLNYTALNSTYNGLFSVSGTTLTVNNVNNNLEFPIENFEVEIKSSTCAHLDSTYVSDVDAPSEDADHNLQTLGLKFSMQLMRCGA